MQFHFFLIKKTKIRNSWVIGTRPLILALIHQLASLFIFPLLSKYAIWNEHSENKQLKFNVNDLHCDRLLGRTRSAAAKMFTIMRRLATVDRRSRRVKCFNRIPKYPDAMPNRKSNEKYWARLEYGEFPQGKNAMRFSIVSKWVFSSL